MSPSIPAPRGALLLFGGGAVASVAAFLPWARMPFLTVKGTSTPWGTATLAAGVLAAVIGYRTARGHRAGVRTRVLAIAAALVAVAIPVVVAHEAHRSLVKERLDAHLQPHGLSAADVLGAEGHPSLFDRFAPFLSGDAAEVVSVVERSMTIRPDVGLWITLAGGMAMSAGAAGTAVRRQRHDSATPEPGTMTTNAITSNRDLDETSLRHAVETAGYGVAS